LLVGLAATAALVAAAVALLSTSLGLLGLEQPLAAR
jgi:hypothetical protein